MRRAMTLAAVVALGASGVACGGGTDVLPDRVPRFCDLLEQADALGDLDLDVENQSELGRVSDMLDELRDAAPSSLTDDIDRIIEAFDAVAAGDFDTLMDESFQRDIEDATENLDRFAQDECGIVIDEGGTGGAGDTDSTDPGSDNDATDGTDASSPGAPDEPDVIIGTPLEVTAQGVAFWPSYDELQGTWAAIITNPDDEVVAEYVTVQATFKDAGGAVVGTDTGYLSEINPGESRAVGTDYLDVPDTAVTVEVITSTDSYRPADDATTPLTFGTPTLVRDDDRLTIVAEVANAADSLVENPTVTAVFRGADGTIIGGTQTYMSFVPPAGAVGVELSTSLTLPADATVELYADWTPISYGDDVDAEQLTITDQGFSTIDSGGTPIGTWAALVTNPNTDVATSFVSVVATFRDAAGTVVSVETATIGGIPAAGTGAVGSDYLYDLPATAATMDVVALALNWTEDPADGTLTVSGLQVTPQEYGGVQVTGELASTFASAGDGVGLVAVFRDADGRLVGGTSGYLDILPANGSTGFSIDSSLEFPVPVTAEVYADAGSLLEP